MQRRFTFVLLLLLVLSLVMTGSVLAQDEELDDFFVSDDGSLAFDFPSGWEVSAEDDGSIRLTNEDDEIYIVPPIALISIGINPTNAQDSAEQIATLLEIEIEITEVTVGAYTGVSFLIDEFNPLFIIIIDTDEGPVAGQVSPPELEDLLFAIMETVDYVAPEDLPEIESTTEVADRDERLDADFESSDGSVSVGYPSEWTAEEDPEIGIIQIQQEEEGTAPIILVPPTSLEFLEIDPTIGAMAVMETILELEEIEAEIEPFSLEMYEGYQVYIIDENDELYIVTLDTDLGVFAAQLGATGFLDAEEIDLFFAMLETLELSAPDEDVDTADGEIAQWATSAEATSQFSDPLWSAQQATGEPDTFDCADLTSAWASSSSTGVDSLTVYFDIAVTPTQVNIYETYNPGSITSIELITLDDEIIPVPNSDDPPGNTECPGVFTVDIEDINIAVYGVIINVDQTIGGSWNEIDAVELVGVAD